MKKVFLTLLLVLVVLTAGCVQTGTQFTEVDNPDDAAQASQDLGEGLETMNSDLNEILEGLE